MLSSMPRPGEGRTADQLHCHPLRMARFPSNAPCWFWALGWEGVIMDPQYTASRVQS